ncbi:sensor histidine kinase [Gandjariella thermophila]|uniref:sensor histidine kinase n=1 Tax=Gandjariella thermophila TaxID=1931992 RepID=UPI001CEFA9B0|nr:histidine kinase [Gandjariella thermophila]
MLEDAANLPRPWAAMARWLRLIPAPVLVLTTVTRPGPQLLGGGKPVLVALVALAVLGNLSQLPQLRLPRRLVRTGLLIFVVTSCLLTVAAPGSSAFINPLLGVHWAVRRSTNTLATITVVVACAGQITGVLLRHDSAVAAFALVLGTVAVALSGLVWRSREARTEQTQLALAREQQAREEHARAAALAERARIARELHDVLAHSLAGLSLNLQTARLLLAREGASAEVMARIEQAQRLAADGIAEARQAVAALRDDPVPPHRRIADLVAAVRLEGAAAADVVVDGTPRELPAEIAQALHRVAQEALTNARKHAPDGTIRVVLEYRPEHVVLTVSNTDGRPAPTVVAGGYGLVGMRERAEQVGGELEAGPVADGWRVRLVVPA